MSSYYHHLAQSSDDLPTLRPKQEMPLQRTHCSVSDHSEFRFVAIVLLVPLLISIARVDHFKVSNVSPGPKPHIYSSHLWSGPSAVLKYLLHVLILSQEGQGKGVKTLCFQFHQQSVRCLQLGPNRGPIGKGLLDQNMPSQQRPN